jgi:hypothetical protein
MTQRHQVWCSHVNGHTDAAQRFSDTYNLHRIGAGYDAIGKWFAARLDDGTTDNVLYDDKYSCVIHQKHNEQFYTFVKICPSDMDPCEAEVMLGTARKLYKGGMRMADPDHKHGGLDLMKRLMVEDQLALYRGVVQNIQLPQKGSK